MAENPRSQNQPVATKKEERQERSGASALSRREPSAIGYMSPFSSLFRRWDEEMNRLFEDFGFGRGLPWGGPRSVRGGMEQWSPQVEVTQRGNELLVRADLPGVKKDDIKVDIADDMLTIHGERREEREEEHEGWHHNERSYGSFYRAIPLPEGTITDSAKASFKNGVLEVVLQAPSREVSRGRRLEIS